MGIRVYNNYVSVYVHMWGQCIQQTSRGPGDILDQRQYQPKLLNQQKQQGDLQPERMGDF
jgi:hypothetical protein